MEGTIIGQYRIVQKIGSGGMGAVYLAEHTLVGRRAAIKVLLPELSLRRAIVTRFFNEARAMTSIPDPGIVQMYDFGYHGDGSAYIVMELLEGETLERRLKRLRRLELVDAMRIIRQVAGSLATAHAAGIIHRDLKPENIFLVRDAEALAGERAKVLDFGVAKLAGDTDGGQTLAGAMMGTPAYMSPEQCRGAGQVDARSDIYALGCVLWYLVTGRLPFDRAAVGELISAHLNEGPGRPSELSPDLPDELDEIVLRCLAKSPDHRFQTMLELQAACDALLIRLSARDVPLGKSAPELLLPAGFRSAPPATGPVDPSGPPDPPTHPTTLSSAASVSVPRARCQMSRTPTVWLGIAGAIVVAGIAVVVAMTGERALPRSTPSPAASVTAPPPPPPPPPATVAAVVDAGVADAAAAVTLVPAPPAQALPTTKPRTRPRVLRPAPDRPDELYDDR